MARNDEIGTSKLVGLSAGRAVNVHATGLVDGESFTVRYAVGTDCNPACQELADYYEDGCLVKLDTKHNPLTLWRPGFYRLVSDDIPSPDVKLTISAPFPITLGPVNNVACCCRGASA